MKLFVADETFANVSFDVADVFVNVRHVEVSSFCVVSKYFLAIDINR